MKLKPKPRLFPPKPKRGKKVPEPEVMKGRICAACKKTDEKNMGYDWPYPHPDLGLTSQWICMKCFGGAVSLVMQGLIDMTNGILQHRKK